MLVRPLVVFVEIFPIAEFLLVGKKEYTYLYDITLRRFMTGQNLGESCISEDIGILQICVFLWKRHVALFWIYSSQWLLKFYLFGFKTRRSNPEPRTHPTLRPPERPAPVQVNPNTFWFHWNRSPGAGCRIEKNIHSKISLKGSTSKKNQGSSFYVQTQTRHFFYRGNVTLKFTLHLHSLIPPNYLYTSMTPENGLGQREGQNQSLQVTRCFLPVFVWILWQHWKESMEKKRFKNSPFKNFPKAIRGRWGPSIVQRFPQKFQVWSFKQQMMRSDGTVPPSVFSKPGCCSSEWYRWRDLWNTPDSRRRGWLNHPFETYAQRQIESWNPKFRWGEN